MNTGANIELVMTVTKGFRWKDRRNNFYHPETMETRHVFMTLVMIWNHTMPADAVIRQSGDWKHHMYNLGEFYNVDYLSIAIGFLARELFKRTDLEPAWLATLQRMHLYLLEKHQVRLLPCK